MSRTHRTSRLAVVALTLVGAALAACADGLPTASRPAPPMPRLAADSSAISAADSTAGALADSTTGPRFPLDSLRLPEECAYAPDSARLDSAGVDPEALAASFGCRDSLALQFP